MSNHLSPTPQSNALVTSGGPYPGLAAAGLAAPDQNASSFSISRIVAALLRYKWLIIAIIALGAAAGYALSRMVKPEYETYATIWVSTEQGQGKSGPIRAGELLQWRSWPQLLRSFVILDKVSTTVPLFVAASDRAAPDLFKGALPSEKIRSGHYTLRVEAGKYTLLSGTAVVETGSASDTIGRTIGLLWKPDPQFVSVPRTIDFDLQTPRSASVTLRDQLGGSLREGDALFRLTLSGRDPQLIARTLNTVSTEFVATAADLKRRNLQEMARLLSDQVDYAQRELGAAEIALEDFRVKTITLPSEGGPVAGGIEMTRDPVLTSFFNNKIDLDNLRRDREALERMRAEMARGELDPNALWAVPAVNSQAPDLKNALSEYSTAESKLRSLRQVYRDEHPDVVEALAQVKRLSGQTIPTLVNGLILQLRARESDLDHRIASASSELRQIPTRTIEEMRLRRNVQTRENLFLTLKNRFEEARLAEASAVPDLSVLDTAVAPLFPTRNTAPRLMLLAFAGSVGFALALAVLLDRVDRRFRYPEQATSELGLNVMAAVPTLGRRRRKKAAAEQAAQVVEAFRTLRLAVSSSIGVNRGPLTLTISSPCPGDGKTLVSSNLALAFAQAGYRTLLVDGDIRRGTLHSVFDAERQPGLVECLRGDAHVDGSLQPTSHPNLQLLASGARLRQGPEYLASRALLDVFADLRGRFDVILVDSPPLGVGIDPFALCLATQNMLLVLRRGATDRVLAKNKLETLDRLPVRVIGSVLNDIPAVGAYKYYGYTEGYSLGVPEGEEIGTLVGR
jgi:succinoglycan biosynthesis transport protein ExoP